MGFPLRHPTPVYEDNTGAIAFTKEHYTSNRLKHVQTRFFWIRQELARGVATVKHIRTHDQRADIFTKNLGKVLHQRHTDFLLRPPSTIT